MIHTTQKGFTLIEMLMVLAIFAVLTSVVVFNYSKFRSDTILTNMAYEVALSIREAQIYGVSARGGSTADYGDAYGIYLPVGENQYVLFKDTEKDAVFANPACVGDECISTYTFQQNITISEIKNCDNGQSENEGVSIVFERPNPEPLMTFDSLSPKSGSRTEITLSAGTETNRYIEVYGNGQIAVLSESKCD